MNGNIPKPELFVEPFCGGASVSLGLLELDVVKRVLLADLDPLVAAFWMQATSNPEQLIADMNDEPVTLERWDYWRKERPAGSRRRALKCLFLNRTTFSGIVGGHAGPIGGRAQTSSYPIGCRFEKEALARRIRNVGRLASEGRIVDVYEGPWASAVRHAEGLAVDYADPKATLMYLDPPYIKKADQIYDLAFRDRDHRALAAFLDGTDHRWILSYDHEPLVLGLYRSRPGVSEFRVTHHYTMTGSRQNPVPGREVIFTNLPSNPVSSGED